MAIRTQIALIAAFLALAAAPARAEVIFNVGFDNHPAGTYTKAMAQADFPGATWYSGGLDSGWGEIVPGRQGRGNALRVRYIAGGIGSATAIQVKARFPGGKASDTAWASYWVKFEDGFDFVRGGKLPGLCGNQCITGGNDANGYNGWSARIMWRPQGTATQYMYYVTNEGYGEDLLFDKVQPKKRFIPGKWHRVNTQIIMNTPGTANGTIRTWFDGELSLERDNILIRHIDTLKVTEFYISTFFGGSDQTWAPGEDMYITYDDFVVMTKAGSSPEPQALYELSANSGRVPVTVNADLTASQNVSANGFSVDFGGGTPLLSGKGLASAEYSVPGIYTIRASAQNAAGQRDEQGRTFIALGGHDLLSDGDSVAHVMPLPDSLRSGEPFRFYLTVLDAAPRIMAGPTSNTTAPPQGRVTPPESLFYGILRYENGTFSAVNGSGSYIEAPGKHGPGTYEVEFTCNFTTTYSLSVKDGAGNTVAGWENLNRRGYETSINRYAVWSSRSQAAVLHMDRWDGNNTGINTAGAKTREPRKSPIAAARKNGISLSIPPSTQPAQIEIFSAKGALVRRISADARTPNLFIPIKSRGLYLYRIKAGNSVFRGSVVVR